MPWQMLLLAILIWNYPHVWYLTFDPNILLRLVRFSAGQTLLTETCHYCLVVVYLINILCWKTKEFGFKKMKNLTGDKPRHSAPDFFVSECEMFWVWYFWLVWKMIDIFSLILHCSSRNNLTSFCNKKKRDSHQLHWK